MGGGVPEWRVNIVHTVEVLITTLIIALTPGTVRSTERTFTALIVAAKRIVTNTARKSGAAITIDIIIRKAIL